MNIGFSGFPIVPLIISMVDLAVIGVIAYFVIKKAVKDGICEAMEKLKKDDEFTKL